LDVHVRVEEAIVTGSTVVAERWTTMTDEIGGSITLPGALVLEKAWRALDVDGIPSLFTEDAIYSSHPLRNADRGRVGVRAYAARAYGEESDVDVRFAVIAAAGTTAVTEYWASLVEDGTPSTLAGLDVLVFEEDGLCSLLREYWFLEPGRHEPPPEWGT
jgi:hypothetical protein